MKRRSASSAVWEVGVTATVRYHYASAKTAMLTKSHNNKDAEDLGKRDPPTGLGEGDSDAAILENSLAVP